MSEDRGRAEAGRTALSVPLGTPYFRDNLPNPWRDMVLEYG